MFTVNESGGGTPPNGDEKRAVEEVERIVRKGTLYRMRAISENAADAGAFQLIGGFMLAIPAGLIIAFNQSLPAEIGGSLVTLAGVTFVIRGAENLHKNTLLQQGKPLPQIRNKRFGRILYHKQV